MKKMQWFISMALVLFLVACGAKKDEGTYKTSYGSGYFYGFFPVLGSNLGIALNKHHLYVVEDTSMIKIIPPVVVRDEYGRNFDSYQAIRTDYFKEDSTSWKRRPVKIYYRKTYYLEKNGEESEANYELVGLACVPMEDWRRK